MSDMKKYFSFLEQLRDSGAANMFGAAPILQEEFPELRDDPKRAVEILLAWMDTYKEKRGDEG